MEIASTSRFTLIDKLGEGGMGVVYDAYDHSRRMHVALKKLRHVEPASLYRFKREFRAVRDLAHSNIITIYELVAEGDDWFLVMERVDGQDVISYVRDGRVCARRAARPPVAVDTTTADTRSTISPRSGAQGMHDARADFGVPRPPPCPAVLDEVVDIGRLRSALGQLAQALHVLHGAGMVHRDLKPSNVFVTAEGRTVLMDFGIVAELCYGADPDTDAVLVGTPSFMAPEQIRGARPSAAADWYAFGVLLYMALAGWLPYQGSPADVLRAKQERDPMPVSRFTNGVPAELERLCMQLLARDPEARPRGERVLHALGIHVAQARPAWDTTLQQSADIFVGRARELAALHAYYDAVLAGESTCVLIEGPSGMGKTSLVSRFLADIASSRPEDARPLVLGARCRDCETLAYNAFDGVIDDVSRHLLELSREERAEVLPEDVGALVRLFPVLRRVPECERAAGLTPDHDSGDEHGGEHDSRDRAVAALRALLRALGRRQPMIVRIDDIHWADRDSVELLRSVMTPQVPGRLLILATLGTAGPDAAEPGDVAAALERQDVCHRMALGSLSADEQRDLMQSLARLHGWAGALDERLWQESSGHPMLLTELVWYAMEAPGELGDARDITLEGIIGRRISRLPDKARELLAIMALVGEPLPLRVLAEAAAMSGTLGERGAAILRITHLAHTVRRMEGERWLTVYHSKVRDTILADMTTPERQAMHGALARALEAWADAPATLLARHWLAAGDPIRAAEHTLVAARRAAEQLAADRAAALYREALAMIEGMAGDIHAARAACRAWLGMVETMHMAERTGGARGLLDRAEERARAHGMAEELATIDSLRGSLRLRAGDVAASLAAQERALSWAAAAGSPACEARALSGLGDVHFTAGRMRAARADYDRCIALCRDSALTDLGLANLPARALARYYQNDLDGALDDCRHACDQAARSGLRHVELTARGALGALLIETGCTRSARRELDHALALAGELGARDYAISVQLTVARQLALDGRPAAARTLIERSMERCSRQARRQLGAQALGLRAVIADGPSVRERALAEGEDLVRGVLSASHRLAFYRDAIEAALAAGAASAVDRYARELEAQTPGELLAWSSLFAERGRALAAYRSGRRDHALMATLRRLHDEMSRAGLAVAARAVGAALA